MAKLRDQGQLLLDRFLAARNQFMAVGDGDDREGRAARTNHTRALTNLTTYIATLEAALVTLANTRDTGPLNSMDEPSSVRVARTALGLATLDDLNRENQAP